MVRKLVPWKTNPENEHDEYPAFVLHYTDFSPNRKDPLARELRVSSSLEQINALLVEMTAANIKKGWEVHSNTPATGRRIVTDATVLFSEWEIGPTV